MQPTRSRSYKVINKDKDDLDKNQNSEPVVQNIDDQREFADRLIRAGEDRKRRYEYLHEIDLK